MPCSCTLVQGAEFLVHRRDYHNSDRHNKNYGKLVVIADHKGFPFGKV